jgi:hypothetical protein
MPATTTRASGINFIENVLDGLSNTERRSFLEAWQEQARRGRTYALLALFWCILGIDASTKDRT